MTTRRSTRRRRNDGGGQPLWLKLEFGRTRNETRHCKIFCLTLEARLFANTTLTWKSIFVLVKDRLTVFYFQRRELISLILNL